LEEVDAMLRELPEQQYSAYEEERGEAPSDSVMEAAVLAAVCTLTGRQITREEWKSLMEEGTSALWATLGPAGEVLAAADHGRRRALQGVQDAQDALQSCISKAAHAECEKSNSHIALQDSQERLQMARNARNLRVWADGEEVDESVDSLAAQAMEDVLQLQRRYEDALLAAEDGKKTVEAAFEIDEDAQKTLSKATEDVEAVLKHVETR